MPSRASDSRFGRGEAVQVLGELADLPRTADQYDHWIHQLRFDPHHRHSIVGQQICPLTMETDPPPLRRFFRRKFKYMVEHDGDSCHPLLLRLCLSSKLYRERAESRECHWSRGGEGVRAISRAQTDTRVQ